MYQGVLAIFIPLLFQRYFWDLKWPVPTLLLLYLDLHQLSYPC